MGSGSGGGTAVVERRWLLWGREPLGNVALSVALGTWRSQWGHDQSGVVGAVRDVQVAAAGAAA